MPGRPACSTPGSFDGSHTYADNGVYTVTVTVFDDDGGAASQTFTVTVNNVAPTLTVVANQTVERRRAALAREHRPVHRSRLRQSAERRRRDDRAFTFTINWGDGTPIDSGPGTIDAPGSLACSHRGSFDGSHTYAATGVYTVTVTVIDDDGGTATGTFQVTVTWPDLDRRPEPDASTKDRRYAWITSASSPIRHPCPGGRSPYSYTINWGDGTTVDCGHRDGRRGRSREQPTHGSFDGAHTYADNGLYTVTVTLTTADGEPRHTTL